ncbi:MAG: hypothetical protein AAGJ35_01690 [Myxococcota bacterium]
MHPSHNKCSCVSSSTQPNPLCCSSPTQDREWFFQRFVIPQDRHGVMHPPSCEAKYSIKKTPLSMEHIHRSFDHKTRRIQQLKGAKRLSEHTLWSFATIPLHRQQQWATFSIADIDSGGEEAVEKALQLCREHQLWAFVQLSESQKHQGGHLWIPCAEKLPAGVLKILAQKIKGTLPYDIDAYPTDRLIRLPLMPHLRHPSGKPKRLALKTTDHVTIPCENPDQALKKLRQQWKENTPEQITRAIESLSQQVQHTETNTPVLPSRVQPRHRNRIQTDQERSVIQYYLRNNDMLAELRTLGVNVNEQGAYKCPWHNDKNPSLFVYYHDQKKEWVCNCLSQKSGCRAAVTNGHYDAFNLYCDDNNLSPRDAVKRIAEENGLGKGKRRPTLKKADKTQRTTPEQHALLLQEKREQVAHIIQEASKKKNVAHVINVTPGGGKSFLAAKQAIEYHKQGKRTVVCVHTHQAAQQWALELGELGFHWKSKTKLCNCHQDLDLNALASLGYTLPSCHCSNCPYEQQKIQSQGKIIIFQHNHLWLQGGKMVFQGPSQNEPPVELVIVDENPLSSFLQKQSIMQTDLKNLLKRLPPKDPSIPILMALIEAGTKTRDHEGKLELLPFLDEHTGGKTRSFIQQAKKSKYAQVQIKLDKESLKHPQSLPPVFLGKMLQALEHDVDKGRSDLLGFLPDADKSWSWQWYRKNTPLESVPPLLRPSLLILDGSAHQEIYKRLLPAWEIQSHNIDIPFSPLVELIQYEYTPNTRRLAHDNKVLQTLIQKIAHELNELELTCTGGISYLKAAPELQKQLGGLWYHYGGQRGLNGLKGGEATIILGAPTVPPSCTERKARALFTDDQEPLSLAWNKTNTPGYYTAQDPRLQWVNQLETTQELYQTLHRSRPILAEQKQTILLMTTWDISPLGIQPTQIRAALHGHDHKLEGALQKYSKRALRHQPKADPPKQTEPPEKQRDTLFEDPLKVCKRGSSTNRRSKIAPGPGAPFKLPFLEQGFSPLPPSFPRAACALEQEYRDCSLCGQEVQEDAVDELGRCVVCQELHGCSETEHEF